MLALSEKAAEAVSTVVDNTSYAPNETGGIRIALAETATDRVALVASVAEQPARDDDVVEALGARVFVDPRLSSTVADKELDATMQDGRVLFRLQDQVA